MSKTSDNVFPWTEFNDDGTVYMVNPGMSLRDYFAGQALAGEISSMGNDTLPMQPGEVVDSALERDADRRAKWCYRQADAMLRAREASHDEG